MTDRELGRRSMKISINENPVKIRRQLDATSARSSIEKGSEGETWTFLPMNQGKPRILL